MTNQQLVESIVKWVLDNPISFGAKNWQSAIINGILPLIAEFKKEVAGDAFDAGYYRRFFDFGDTDEDESNYPDRETYIDNLNK